MNVQHKVVVFIKRCESASKGTEVTLFEECFQVVVSVISPQQVDCYRSKSKKQAQHQGLDQLA